MHSFWRNGFMVIAIALGGAAAQAQPADALEAKIGIRVLDFLVDPGSRGNVAVLYDRDNAESLRDAGALLRAFQDAAGLARSRFQPKLVERRALAQESDLKAVVVGGFITDPNDEILRYAISNHTLVLSTGLDCVRRRQCAVGVAAEPEVEIDICPDLIRRSGIRFADGFQLMAKEI
jgi:hypothetical protein